MPGNRLTKNVRVFSVEPRVSVAHVGRARISSQVANSNVMLRRPRTRRREVWSSTFNSCTFALRYPTEESVGRMSTKVLTSEGVHTNESRPVSARRPSTVRQFCTCSGEGIGEVMSRAGVNAGALCLSDRDRVPEHTDVTDVPGQSRMQYNRVKSRRTLHDNDKLSQHLG